MAITKDKVSKILDIDIPDWVNPSDAKEILKEVGDFLINEVISYTESGVSAVDGEGAFPKLNKKYAIREKAGDTTANLDLNGDMLGSLTYEVLNSNEIEIGIFEKDQAIKAYNHNVGDTLPKRQFIPNEKEKFDSDIMDGVDELLKNLLDELDYNPSKQDGNDGQN